MAMSAAERARKYRERIKSDPGKHRQYLQNEKKRYKARKQTGKILSIADMTNERDKRSQRRQWRTRKANERQEKRRLQEVTSAMGTPPLSPLSETSTSSSRETNVLSQRRVSGQKRIRKDRARAYRTVNKLKDTILNKERQIERLRKQAYRLRVALKTRDNSPRTKTSRMLKGQDVNENVRKALIFHNTMVTRVKQVCNATKSQKARNTISNIFRSKLLRKYRLLKTAATSLGLSRKSLDCQQKTNKPTAANAKFAMVKQAVSMFFVRDDVSRMTAGKKETITRNKIKKQKRLLTDSMKNLHLKFLMDSKTLTISYSLFCRMRPFWVCLPTISDRDTCQCKVHANAQFMTDILRKWKAIPTSDVEKLVEETHCNPDDKACMYGDCADCKSKLFASSAYDPGKQISWFQWQDRVEMIETGDQVMRNVKRTVKGEVFGTLEHLRNEFQDMRPKLSKHIYNIRHQYRSLRNLRQNQLHHSAVVHMDFSENYGCKFSEEIQSVHFGASHQQVSLHTGVVYLPSQTISFCTFAENTRHDPPAIWAHIHPVLQHVRQIDPLMDIIHFVSDGPTTQYRCRKNFFLFSTKSFDYGIQQASWNFLEAGHGKGPADGVGAVVKRTADAFVSQGRDLPDAKSVYDAIHGSNLDIKSWFISTEDINNVERALPETIPPIPGTMKLHQVWTSTRGSISYRDVSCFCGRTDMCSCYSPSSIVIQAQVNKEQTTTANARVPTSTKNPESVLEEITVVTGDMVGRWCVVSYDGLPYPGVIQCVDDGEAEVKVMHRIGNNRFFWPRTVDDIVWYPIERLVTLMPPVEPVTGRHQQIKPCIWQAVLKKLGI